MNFKSAILFILLIVTISCTRNEFEVKIDLPENVTANYRLVFYASDPVKGWYTEIVAPVQNGKFETKGATRNPAIVFIFKDSGMPVAAFYVERGDKIMISGTSPDPAEWKISGNKLTERWNEWTRGKREILASSDEVAVNREVTKFVSENPSDPLSVIIASLYYAREAEGADFSALWDKIDKKAFKGGIGELVSTTDLLTGSPIVAENPRNLILLSLDNGRDSIPLMAKPSIIYFWRGNSEKRSESMEELRRLAGEFPDSSLRNIVDICMETDSFSWVAPLRTDSLRHTVRAWMPGGEVDENAIKLGVGETPYFIILDKKGRTVYSGSDEVKAADKFRGLMKK